MDKFEYGRVLRCGGAPENVRCIKARLIPKMQPYYQEGCKLFEGRFGVNQDGDLYQMLVMRKTRIAYLGTDGNPFAPWVGRCVDMRVGGEIQFYMERGWFFNLSRAEWTLVDYSWEDLEVR